MIHRASSQMETVQQEGMKQGVGSVTVTKLLQPDEMLGQGRMFSRFVVPPGSSIGLHRHDGEEEFYYLLAGRGVYQHDEQEIEVGPGDLVSVDNHHSHGLANTGDEPLEFIALVLFTDEDPTP